MCVDKKLSNKNFAKRESRWRFHRLRDSLHKLEEGVTERRPIKRRHTERRDPRISLAPRPEPQAFSAGEGLARAAAHSQRLQDERDAREFADAHQFAALNAA
jgi:hypothetical protein